MSFICGDCRRHRIHADPYKFDLATACIHCGGLMVGEVREPPPGIVQFDHTFTPEQADLIVETVPEDSYHWEVTWRVNKIPEYTAIMRAGEWKDQTLELGFCEHPIRFNEAGEITHGVMRLVACANAGVPFRTAVSCPPGVLEDVLAGRKPQVVQQS